MTVGGVLGDRIDHLRVFRLGIFGIAAGAAVTFVGGVMNSFPVVLVGRGLEGVGVALFLPASTALLLDVFPMAERGGAQGMMMVISMFVTAFAPTLIGIVIQSVSLPSSYLFTVSAALITLLLLSQVKYTQKMAQPTPFDYTGSVLLFLAVSLLTIGIMQAGNTGLTSPSVLMQVGAGLLLGFTLVLVSSRKTAPLIQFSLLRIRTVSIALFVVLMRFLPNVMMGAFVARFVQQALDYSPTVTGMLMILPVLAQVVVAPIAGRMLDKVGPRRPVVLGIVLLAVGLVILALGFQGQNLWLILIGTILGGAGFSFTNPVQMAALSATPLEQRGMLAGLLPLAGNFGTALFVALLTARMGGFMSRFAPNTPGATEAASLSGALSILSWISLVFILITLAIALMLPRLEVGQQTPRQETSEAH